MYSLSQKNNIATDKIAHHISPSVEKFVEEIIEINSIQFGDFELGNHEHTSAYFDLRLIPSHPLVMKRTIDLICAKIIEQDFQFDLICGVPFAGISFATCVALELNKAMILKRKAIKKYGTHKLIEGSWKKGMRCLIIEDVVVLGNSIAEVVEDLRSNGLIVEHAVTILDREQGGLDNLWTKNNIQLHSVLTCNMIYRVIQKKPNFDEISAKFLDFIKSTCIPQRTFDIESSKNAETHNSLGLRLRSISERKRSNIILAVDFDNSDKILNMVNVCGPHVCAVKLHADIIHDFNGTFIENIVNLSIQHNFLLIEDRKLCDTGAVVSAQYTSGTISMSSWAHLVTVHGILGDETVKALKNAAKTISEDRGCLLISEMSSSGSFKAEAYRSFVLNLARKHSDFVAGFICQDPLTMERNFINVTPGVRLEANSDCLDQLYKNPTDLINKSDFYVVGRGITESCDPLESILKYKKQLYHDQF